ncbi:MAG: MBOAT family O-acyltransferase [Prevotella multiformis]|uniref:MBOAT family O-acyltransferase n=1 Tax=Prevotella multiformis TaxID=282402 RepID=UPI003F9F2248
MAKITQLTITLLDFLSIQDKSWSLCTLAFMASFLVFFAIYIGLNRYRQPWTKAYVIAFSLFFAYKANGILMLMLPITAISSWYLTRFMMRLRRGKIRRSGLAIVILAELTPLLYYKYTDFTLEILHEILHSNFSPEKMLLPVGISFFTFQAISYTVDVYKGRYPKTAELTDYAFYLTFFPLLIAGPITRAEVLLPQVGRPREDIDSGLVYKGLWLIICGMVKKALIADYIAQYNNIVFDAPAVQSGFGDLMGVLGFSVQIYCDFSGYSDLAIGVAALMGYELKDNFNFPYQSLNLTEFWHRWHISLSTWFRDYLYIPLGGNRRGALRTYLNSFLAMIVAGLWHGASWMFVAWGVLHGIGLVVHKLCKNNGLDRIPDNTAVKAISWCLTFGYVTFAWIFFRSPDMATATTLMTNILQTTSLSDAYTFLMEYPLWLIVVLISLELHSIRGNDYSWLQDRFVHAPWLVKLGIFALVLQLAINFSQHSIQPFIYTQF